jgi:hypothetical protein
MKITPEMIEAAAEAIHEKFGRRSTFIIGYCRPLSWDKLSPALRDDYRAEALAALSAGFAAVLK